MIVPMWLTHAVFIISILATCGSFAALLAVESEPDDEGFGKVCRLVALIVFAFSVLCAVTILECDSAHSARIKAQEVKKEVEK